MKPPRSKPSQRGSTLIITLIFGVVVLVVLASILTLAQSRTKIRQRSTDWNSAIPVAEAGVEEAFTHLKDDKNNLTTNGWSLSSGVYQKTRTNSDRSYYIVTISTATTTPVIDARGYVPAPLGGGYISRWVRVTVASSGTSLFGKGILARSTINFAGDMQLNSYDSSNTNYSNPNGTYNTNKTAANGGIASMAGSGTAIDLAGAKIYGSIQYPGGATYNIGSGTVGDTAYVSNPANSGTIQTGHKDNTLNITIPATPLPTDGSGNIVNPSTWTYKAPLASAITTNGVSGVKYVLTSGDWSIGSDTFHNESIYIPPGNNVRLYVGKNGRWQMGSSDVIKISADSSFQIYNDSDSDAVFTGIANDSQIPTHFYYWGLSGTTGTKLTLTGGGFFAGAIYAYYQNVILTGGSSGNIRDFYGALVANTVVNSGHFYMSYDQALGFLGGTPPTTFSYREL